MKRENAKMTDEEYEAFQKEEADFWNSYLEEQHKKALPDITVTHNGYTVKQTYAFMGDYCGKPQYWQLWYDAHSAIVLRRLSDWKSEEELREECEQMDHFLMAIRSRID